MKGHNEYYPLVIFAWSSLSLTFGIFYFFIPYEQVEVHGWPYTILSFFIVWYAAYLLLVVGKIFIWDNIFMKIKTKGKSE